MFKKTSGGKEGRASCWSQKRVRESLVRDKKRTKARKKKRCGEERCDLCLKTLRHENLAIRDKVVEGTSSAERPSDKARYLYQICAP